MYLADCVYKITAYMHCSMFLDATLTSGLFSFDGAIMVRRLESPDRSFAFEVTFLVDHPLLVALSARKPPLHFHPHQEEYIQVLEGSLAVEIEGEETILLPDRGELRVRPWTNHRLYSPQKLPGEAEEGAYRVSTASRDQRKTVFLLSGAQTSEVFQLDTMFFQNWYGYQDEMVMSGKEPSLIITMCMFDAGGSYLSLPKWFPFSYRLAQILGIVVGRWLGALLGYQPFYPKWTTNWRLACEKMETSLLLKRISGKERRE
ncbi:uncharacterized protein F4812DRAFT_65906 [Daldinia caldariorum]|uniref:uncharacterized protein n=1 Tax=Daldinia caldariorum TaxID=326644 RepID=UPI002007712C|nr:uncharacterized protein F4812DRAFT_65906 [Daldinia caldariorum]KAI1466786.1 hypothetical protein F4812DRAFT_65906 [Daldinia caldariorum]